MQEKVRDHSIVVGAIDNNGVITDYTMLPSGNDAFSDFLKDSFIVAPGGSDNLPVYSTYLTSGESKSTYGNMAGTSMAAPHVTGVAALVMQAAPNLTAPKVREILLKNADSVKTNAWTSYPYPSLNAEKAVQAALATLPQPAIITTPLYDRYTSGSGEQCYDRGIGTAKSTGVYTLSNTTYCLRGGKWVDATGVDNERYLDSQGNLYPFSSVEIKHTGNNIYTAGYGGSTIWNMTFTQKSAGVYSQSVKSVADTYSVHFDPNSYIYQNSETLPLLIAKYNAGTPYTGYLSSGGDIGFLFASSPAATEGLIYYFRLDDPNRHNSNRVIVDTGTWSKKSFGSNTQIIELDEKSSMLDGGDQYLRKIYYKNSSESGVREGNKSVAGRTNTMEVFDRTTFNAMLARDGLPATPN